MKKKQDAKKASKSEIRLTPEESGELQMILDRLAVQDPDGETLDNYLRSLRKAFVGREALLAALIDRLSRSPSKVGFQAFRTLQELIVDKQLQRIVRQAAYRFGQKGFVEAPDAAAPERVVLIQKEVRSPEAHMIPAEGALWLLSAFIPESSSHAGPVAVTAFLDGHFAHFHVKVVESSHRLYREYLQRLADSLPEGKPVDIPIWHAARLFFDMLEWHTGSNYTPGIEEAQRLLRPYREPERAPYAYELLPEIEHPEQQIHDADTPSLLEAVDASWLLFSKDELAGTHTKIGTLEHSVLVVPREIQEDRSRDMVREAADSLCTGERRQFFQRFFEEQAMWFKRSGRESLATAAWIVAQHLGSSALASENPLVLHMVIHSMRAYWPEDFKDQPPEEGEGHRTDSGLIIP